MLREVVLEELESTVRAKRREGLKATLLLRQREKRRTTRRRLEDAVRLGLLASILVREYLEVVSWGERRRVLRLKRREQVKI